MAIRCILYAILLIISSVFGQSSSGWSSQLTPPTIDPQAASLAGNVVALPLNPSSAFFHNPAQLPLLPNALSLGLFAIRFQPRYQSPLGYDQTSRELPIVPSVGYVTNRWAPLHVGIGIFGTLGFNFNYPADPAHGVPNNFYTDLAILSLTPTLAYSLAPNLHIGVELNPSYGRLRFKTPSPIGRIDVDVRGPGVFGTVGLFYTPTAKLSVGIGYKTPGAIWMFGNARVAGAGDNATVNFQLPQSVEWGVAYHFTERLTFVAQARWTELSVFEETQLKFEERTFLNRTAVQDARDCFRLGGGVQYILFPGVTLHVGFSWERWAIAASSLAPTLSDNTDFLFPFGVTIERGRWQVHLMGGLTHTESREVSPEQNPFFAGRYSLDESVFGVEIIRRL